jgi:hypothetical protein
MVAAADGRAGPNTKSEKVGRQAPALLQTWPQTGQDCICIKPQKLPWASPRRSLCFLSAQRLQFLQKYLQA